MKTLMTMCILLVCSSCTQVTSNSTLEADGVVYRQEKKANWILTTVDLKNLKWDGLIIDKGKAEPQDVKVNALTGAGPVGVEVEK